MHLPSLPSSLLSLSSLPRPSIDLPPFPSFPSSPSSDKMLLHNSPLADLIVGYKFYSAPLAIPRTPRTPSFPQRADSIGPIPSQLPDHTSAQPSLSLHSISPENAVSPAQKVSPSHSSSQPSCHSVAVPLYLWVKVDNLGEYVAVSPHIVTDPTAPPPQSFVPTLHSSSHRRNSSFPLNDTYEGTAVLSTNNESTDLTTKLVRVTPIRGRDLKKLSTVGLCASSVVLLNESIGWLKLANVTVLQLCCNHLSQIPPTIAHLTSLTHLSLSLNRLSDIPILPLPNLVDLNLSNNKFKSFPLNFFAHMPNLTVLDLSHNHLTSIPTSIRHCKKLISLNVAGNQIDSVPFCLLNLPFLRKLRLSDNPLRTECPLPQRRSPPSLFELSARTILNSPELNSMDISDMIPESMKGYFSQAKRCDHVSCRQWYVGDEVKRYKAVERGEERIVAWWGLCNAHWWDEEERIRSLFVKSANTVRSRSNGTGRSNHFQNCYKAACRHSAKRLHSSSCIPPPASTENALFPPTLGLGPSTPTAKTDSKPASLPTKLRRHFSQSMLPPAFSQSSLSSLTELESSSTLPPLPPLPVRESPVKSNLKRFVTKQSKRLSMDSKKLLSDKAKVKLNADVPSARNGRSNNANNHRNSNSRSRSRSRSTPAPPPTPSGLHTPLSNSIPPSPTLPPRSPSLSIIPPQSFNISSSASLSRPQSNSRSNSPLPSPSNHQRSSSPTTAVPPSPSRADSITSLPLPPSLSASFSSSSSSSSSASSPSESVITLVSSYPEEILETEIVFTDSNSDQLSEKWSGKLKLKGKHVVGNVKRFLSPSENFKNQWSGMRKDLKMVWRRG